MTPDAEQMKLESQLCFSLYSSSNALVRAYRPLLKALDLTYLQYMAMMVLWEHRSLNVKQLGEMLHLDSGTLTPLLKRMEEKQLVTRQRSDADERVRVISVTEHGDALRHAASEIPHKLSCQVDLSIEDARALKHLSDKLLSVLI